MRQILQGNGCSDFLYEYYIYTGNKGDSYRLADAFRIHPHFMLGACGILWVYIKEWLSKFGDSEITRMQDVSQRFVEGPHQRSVRWMWFSLVRELWVRPFLGLMGMKVRHGNGISFEISGSALEAFKILQGYSKPGSSWNTPVLNCLKQWERKSENLTSWRVGQSFWPSRIVEVEVCRGWAHVEGVQCPACKCCLLWLVFAATATIWWACQHV